MVLQSIAEEATSRPADEQLAREREARDHCVKNIVVVAAGMVRRKLGGAVDPAAEATLEAVSRQMFAMAQMHEMISHAADEDLAEVIEGVGHELVGSDPHLQLTVEAEHVIVPAHRAAVLAQIVTELLTNAIRHGFRDGGRGKITVSLRPTEGNLLAMSVTDDGAPLPNYANGIGLNLVARLAEHLGGDLIVATDPKRFTVTFPRSEAAWRSPKHNHVAPALAAASRQLLRYPFARSQA